MKEDVQTENIEVDLLLDAIFQRYGYDFRCYARASIERRIVLFMSSTGYTSVSEMIPMVLNDKAFFSRMIRYFSVPVTEMFRDPQVYLAVREKVIPLLRTWSHIKIWHAGCATGEEVYSLAIILKEEGLYDRATIYATDFNDEVLERARAGVFEAESMKDATRNYQLAGGTTSFSEYYHARYGKAAMDGSLKERITFTNHNLAVDEVFGEIHLIFSRNVLIYFNRDLQNRAMRLFTESLVHGGFLCLGTKEDIKFTNVNKLFEEVDRKHRIFKKKVVF